MFMWSRVSSFSVCTSKSLRVRRRFRLAVADACFVRAGRDGPARLSTSHLRVGLEWLIPGLHSANHVPGTESSLADERYPTMLSMVRGELNMRNTFVMWVRVFLLKRMQARQSCVPRDCTEKTRVWRAEWMGRKGGGDEHRSCAECCGCLKYSSVLR